MSKEFLKELGALHDVQSQYKRTLLQELSIKEFGISCIRRMYLPRTEENNLVLKMDKAFPVKHTTLVNERGMMNPVVVGGRRRDDDDDDYKGPVLIQQQDSPGWLGPLAGLLGTGGVGIAATCLNKPEVCENIYDTLTSLLKKHSGFDDMKAKLKEQEKGLQTLQKLLTEVMKLSTRDSSHVPVADEDDDPLKQLIKDGIFITNVKNWIKASNVNISSESTVLTEDILERTVDQKGQTLRKWIEGEKIQVQRAAMIECSEHLNRHIQQIQDSIIHNGAALIINNPYYIFFKKKLVSYLSSGTVAQDLFHRRANMHEWILKNYFFGKSETELTSEDQGVLAQVKPIIDHVSALENQGTFTKLTSYIESNNNPVGVFILMSFILELMTPKSHGNRNNNMDSSVDQ